MRCVTGAEKSNDADADDSVAVVAAAAGRHGVMLTLMMLCVSLIRLLAI